MPDFVVIDGGESGWIFVQPQTEEARVAIELLAQEESCWLNVDSFFPLQPPSHKTWSIVATLMSRGWTVQVLPCPLVFSRAPLGSKTPSTGEQQEHDRKHDEGEGQLVRK